MLYPVSYLKQKFKEGFYHLSVEFSIAQSLCTDKHFNYF